MKKPTTQESGRKYGFGGTGKEQASALEKAGFPPHLCDDAAQVDEAPEKAEEAK